MTDLSHGNHPPLTNEERRRNNINYLRGRDQRILNQYNSSSGELMRNLNRHELLSESRSRQSFNIFSGTGGRDPREYFNDIEYTCLNLAMNFAMNTKVIKFS